MDGSHVIEKYLSTILVAYLCDAQRRMFPIAFVIAEL